MRTNLLQRIHRNASVLLFAVLLGLATVGCDEEKDFSRSNTLLVFVDPVTQEPLSNKTIICPVKGGDSTLYVRTNVECKLSFRTGDDDKQWLQLEDKGWNDAVQAHAYRIIWKSSAEDTYVKRTGTLSIVYPQDYLGEFIVFSQGFGTRLKETFEWLNTGSDIPFNTTGEVNIANWVTAQKDKGWTSPVGEGQTPYIYSKREYLKLGDGEHASILQTPDLAKMVNDSILMLTFKAVAYAAEDGTQDNNSLTVSIINGGKFYDGTKSQTIQLPYYNPFDPNVATSMWKGVMQKLFLLRDADEKFTADTRIVFSTPDGANRAFIDDVNLYIIDKDSHYILPEKDDNTNQQ